MSGAAEPSSGAGPPHRPSAPPPAAAVSTPTISTPAARHDGPAVTATGAALLVTVVAVIGAILDEVVSGRIEWVFGGTLVATSVLAALRLVRRDLLAAVIVPPLAYALAITVVLQVAPVEGGAVRQRALDLAVTMSERAPFLLVAEVLAGLVALRRRRRRGPGP